MKEKPILRIFGDYCCSFALWNDHNHEILDGTEEQLIEIGILPQTVVLLKAIVDVYSWEPSDREPNQEARITYRHLIEMARLRLEREIGDRFTIMAFTDW